MWFGTPVCTAGGDVYGAGSNRDPTADAGPDQTVEGNVEGGANVQLDGSGSSDVDGDALTYVWTWQDADGDLQQATGISPTVFLPFGATTVTLVVSDCALAFAADTIMVTVSDTEAPVTTVDLLGEEGDNGWFTSNVTVTMTATDLPDPGGTGVAKICYIYGGAQQVIAVNPPTPTATASFVVSRERTQTVSAYAVDAAGNAGERVPVTMRIDKTPPKTSIVAARPPDEGGQYTDPVDVTIGAGDNASGVRWTKYSLDGGAWTEYGGALTLDEAGTYTIQAYSRDIAGNEEAPPVQLVIVLDGNQPPVAEAGPDQTVEANTVGGADVQLDGTGSHDPDGDDLTYLWTWEDGNGGTQQATGASPTVFLPHGKTAVTLVVNDGELDSEPDTVDIIVVDATPPTTTLALACDEGDNGWFVSDVTVEITASDRPDPGGTGVAEILYTLDGGAAQRVGIEPATMTASAAFVISQEGVHTVEAWAVDAAGNDGPRATQSVKIDKTPPETSIIPDRDPDADGKYTDPVTVTINASDNVSGVAWTKHSVEGGTCVEYSGALTFDETGTYTIEAHSRDVAGNEEEPPVELVIVLELNKPPVADAGPDQTVEANTVGGAEVQLDGSGSSDPDGDALTYLWTWEDANGDPQHAAGVDPTIFLPLGETAVSLVVKDGEFGSAPDTVAITVEDTTPPEVTGLAADPDTLWPPNHKMRDVTLAYDLKDIADPDPQVQISVTCNEPEFDAAADVQIIDAHHLRLRAEREGRNKDGRIYTITLAATDASGNSAQCQTTVTVPHDQGKKPKG